MSAELSLRYWAQQLSERVTPELLRGREQALIQTLQPPLNFPFHCSVVLPSQRHHQASKIPPLPERPAFSERKQALKHAAAESRGLPSPLYPVFKKPAFRTKEATWVLLIQLGGNTLQHFEAAKRLRSNDFRVAALCDTLHRLP